ncbi:hypothetical protein F5B20DRAFT_594522 [Whalleya microplaca]|nr:hypothetical protein F5B20DRAFT_594522 [Whalleya microplaca]
MVRRQVNLPTSSLWARINSRADLDEAIRLGLVGGDTLYVDNNGAMHPVDWNNSKIGPQDILSSGHVSSGTAADARPKPRISVPVQASVCQRILPSTQLAAAGPPVRTSGPHQGGNRPRPKPYLKYSKGELTARLANILDEFSCNHRLPQPLQRARHVLVTDNQEPNLEEWWMKLDRYLYHVLYSIFQIYGIAYNICHYKPPFEIPGIIYLIGDLDGVVRPGDKDLTMFSDKAKPVVQLLASKSSRFTTEDNLRKYMEPRCSLALRLVHLNVELRKYLAKPWMDYQTVIVKALCAAGQPPSQRAQDMRDALALIQDLGYVDLAPPYGRN